MNGPILATTPAGAGRPPMTTRNTELKLAEFRARALEAAALAEASTLDRVREKHELAAATWSGLAGLQERMAVPLGPVADPPPDRA